MDEVWHHTLKQRKMCIAQYRIGYPRMKQAGMFSLRIRFLQLLIRKTEAFAVFYKTGQQRWWIILKAKRSKQRPIARIWDSLSGIEFQGSVEVGFLPLEDFIAKKRENEASWTTSELHLELLGRFTSRTDAQSNMFDDAFSHEVKTPWR